MFVVQLVEAAPLAVAVLLPPAAVWAWGRALQELAVGIVWLRDAVQPGADA